MRVETARAVDVEYHYNNPENPVPEDITRTTVRMAARVLAGPRPDVSGFTAGDLSLSIRENPLLTDDVRWVLLKYPQEEVSLMATGFLMKDSLFILHLTGERDALGSESAVFTRGAWVQCGWGSFSESLGDTRLGRETKGLFMAIIPSLEDEPWWVEHAGKVFQVKETRRFMGFGMDHWELVLEEYLGRFEIT